MGGFPLDKTEPELAKLGSPYDEMRTIKIVRDKTDKYKVYASLELAAAEDADRVIGALGGGRVGNWLLMVYNAAEP